MSLNLIRILAIAALDYYASGDNNGLFEDYGAGPGFWKDFGVNSSEHLQSILSTYNDVLIGVSNHLQAHVEKLVKTELLGHYNE